MCFGGGSPQAPKVKYQGPSKKEIKENERQLAQYQQQMSEQQAAFQQQLQAQIDAADTQYAALEEQLAESEKAQREAKAQGAADLAAAAANGMAYQGSSGYVTVQESEAVGAEQTKAITDKKKPNSSLKIAQNAVEAASGTGLNIGV